MGKFLKVFILLVAVIAIMGGMFVLGYSILGGNYDIIKGLGSMVGFESDKRVNGLILGTDESGLRTDFIMFVSYNPQTQKVNLISIPRDTRVPDSVDKKINSIYQKNKQDSSINEVEKILGVSIKYYAVINFKGLRNIVDDVGGVPIDVPMDMHYHDPYQNLYIDLNKGYQVLDGKNAEGLVRFRHGYADADLGRIRTQQKFISALAGQILKPQNIPKLPSIIKTITENVKTNISVSSILGYLGDAAKISQDKIIAETLPGDPKYIGDGSYFIYDKQKTKQMVEAIFADDEGLTDKQIVERNKQFKVEVFNGTSIPGLGSKVADKLEKKGFNVVRVENYDSTVENTKIIERTRNIEGVYVKNAITVGEVSTEYNNSSDVDATVIVGQDANE